jgi:hypothetical protein
MATADCGDHLGDAQRYMMEARMQQERARMEHQQQAQLQAGPNTLFASAGSGLGSIYSNGTGTWDTAVTTTNATDTLSINSAQITGAWLDDAVERVKKPAKKLLKFFRVNQVVELEEGGKFDDPVDELRLKVARWLNPKEKYNFA